MASGAMVVRAADAMAADPAADLSLRQKANDGG